jgi:hypothetical protein
MLAYEQLHDPLQRGMMRQRMKGWKTEDLVEDHLERSVIFGARGAGICYSIEWIGVRGQPSRAVQNFRNVSQEWIQVLRRKQASHHHVAMRVHLFS